MFHERLLRDYILIMAQQRWLTEDKLLTAIPWTKWNVFPVSLSYVESSVENPTESLYSPLQHIVTCFNTHALVCHSYYRRLFSRQDDVGGKPLQINQNQDFLERIIKCLFRNEKMTNCSETVVWNTEIIVCDVMHLYQCITSVYNSFSYIYGFKKTVLI